MIYLVLIFFVLHVGFYLLLAYYWSLVPLISKTSEGPSLSVIVPVRNEEKVIEKVLASLEYQEYDKNKYEVIIINDFSEDETLNIIKECENKLSMHLKVVTLSDSNESGKKQALTKGVEIAKNDFILTTDADCQMGPKWLSSYAACIEGKKMVAGPVALKGQGFWASLQQAEFSGLIGFGAVTLFHNNPGMCSGANLAFSKEAFFEVGGYTDNFQIPSGDDEFLLFNISKRYPGQAVFLKNSKALVITSVHKTLRGFMNQRIRWISKWKHNKNPNLRLAAVLFFLDHLVWLIAIVYTIAGGFHWIFLSFLFVTKWLSTVIYISPIHTFLNLRSPVLSLLVIQIIYPFHILIMGVNSIFGSYTWKGRKY
ncbi:MAG: glycosyltransferase [Bacteroidota bacterium]